jgi:hypothetical protein
MQQLNAVERTLPNARKGLKKLASSLKSYVEAEWRTGVEVQLSGFETRLSSSHIPADAAV